jgi:23S rRNA pseudouridine1911/1915/1917 synthase
MDGQLFSFRFQAASEARLDHFLVGCLPQYSRARLQGLINDGLVFVNGAPAKKNGQMIGPGALVELRVPASSPTALIAEHIPLDVIFENEDVMVVNKPAGMVVHPAAGHASGTLANAAIGHSPAMEGIGGEERPGVVHRLDKDTSGLIMLAKNDAALHSLQEQFRLRKVEKTYLALVDGGPPTPFGRVEAAIGRDPSHRKQMAIVPEGKGRQAISEYSTSETFSRHSLLEWRPMTGRTHQIRLHCAFLGCPIVGDRVYGRKKPSLPIDRHFLHAAKLVVTLPGAERPREFKVELPDQLQRILEELRKDPGAPAA